MPKNKTITILTPFFYPEDTAIGLYTTQFSKFLLQKGYLVNIITGFPNYPQWKIFPDYMEFPTFFSETYEGAEIIRYKQYVPEKVTFKGRILMMLSFTYGTFINLRKIKKTDLVICIVPYTISLLPSIYLAKRRKAKLWAHVQDFEFDLAFDSGVVNEKNLFFSFFKKSLFYFEKKLFNAAAVVSSISYSMMNKIKEKSITSDTYYFPNWVSSEKINPTLSKKHKHINQNEFTLLYSGNIGAKQDWAFLMSLCARINPNDGISIVIVGDGAAKDELKAKLSMFSFVRFFDPVPYEDLNDLLCSADVHFLFQKTDVVDTVMPSKILGMMASQKPSIITGSKSSEVLTIIEQSRGGYYFSENNCELIYQQIIELKNNSVLCNEIGLNARNYILNHFSEEKILEKFSEKIHQILT